MPTFWSTNTWLPLIALFVQHPCITPELSTGLGLVIIAAVAMPVPAPRASVAAPATMTLGPIAIIFPPLITRDRENIALSEKGHRTLRSCPRSLSPR